MAAHMTSAGPSYTCPASPAAPLTCGPTCPVLCRTVHRNIPTTHQAPRLHEAGFPPHEVFGDLLEAWMVPLLSPVLAAWAVSPSPSKAVPGSTRHTCTGVRSRPVPRPSEPGLLWAIPAPRPAPCLGSRPAAVLAAGWQFFN
ncbi:hypothetical protein HJG60_008179 [Phyllostomus discolor]|uniref:Uncharacterized protein n=1 Tax=Phyllostomus discolor TaxID=89673 RepID=A0A834DSH5_9CHIR|nr:hypothetical protein HJG60_008179 [Phyllostomus discolor]